MYLGGMIIASTVLITLALVFYSTGIWAERISRRLKAWHVITFWLGFLFDVSGTLVMHKMAQGHFDILDLHTLTGQLALWLMLVHATWATVVIRKGLENWIRKFHRYSIFVWLVWLVPYFGGMFMGMSH
jgi:uncharacterized repeat protein (TIGR03987 family)